MLRRSLPSQVRSRGVTAVLGPTNTGKTHLAIERMLGHESGMIGLPLRLLAREVYQKVVDKAGEHNVALVTGEEKIKPDRPRYWISTVEAMPRDLDLAFVAVDEVQLAADLDRGHVFTDRLLNQRGREETLLIGSATMRPLVEALIPGVHVITRPRLSKLSFAGEKKISRLPHRSAIVAFSAEEVYAIAELIRRQRGGAAVVLGALSPRTRNAQVQLFQNGDVDYLVATDAVGMGLNLDVDHVAFASDKKFDGFRFRKLFPAELGQIAGRAGRYMRDGTFGTAGRCPPLPPETVEALENHAFDPVRVLQWRNPDLDFSTLAKLQESLADQPREHGLIRAPFGEDVLALEHVAREEDVKGFARSKAAVERLWEVCQVPDYRKVSPAGHADLVATLYRFLMKDGAVPADWFSRQVAMLDRTDGDIDTLSNRIAQVRTWTFVANRPDWLKDPEHWQGVTRQVEDSLSDALHERLAQRFVDRRTSVLMRRLRENARMEAEITASGDVTVEGQHVGRLHGFHFAPDPQATGEEAKALRNAAQKGLASEIEARAERFSAAADASLVISNDGTIRWQGDPVARLEAGEKLFEPKLRIVADEQLTGPAREKVEVRLRAWLKAHIVRLLGPVLQLEDSQELQGIARGIGFQVAEALGVLERSKVLNEVRSLDQDGRAALRKQGVRFGAYHLYLPALLKPAPRLLATQLWALKHGGLDQKGLQDIAMLASSGRTSIPVDPEIAKGLYRAAGYRVCGGRAVRVDILERLADLIRPAIAYRPGLTPGAPPPGAADNEGFVTTIGMTSLVGCSGEDFASILKSLGYVMDRRPGPAITVPLRPAAPITPAVPAAEGANGAETSDAVSSEAQSPADHAASYDAEASPEPTAEAAQAEEAPRSVQQAGEVPPAIEPDAVETEAQGLDSAGTDHAHAAELMAEASVTPAADETVPEAPLEVPPAPDETVPGEPAEVAPAVAEVLPEGPASVPEEARTPGAADGVEAPAEPAPPAEPVLIEVWRLHRQHREGGQARHGRGRPDQRRGERRGGPRQDRPQDRPRQDGPRPDRPPGEERRAEGQAPASSGQGRPYGQGRAQDRTQGQDRPDRQGRPDERPRPDQRRDARRNRNGQGPGKPSGQGPRPEHRQDQRPERREKAPDPNSPFAKLLALKQQLEARDTDKR
ncbi:MAG TPA: helicase-related protein [Beijerinckiaceae bacterium]|jgi:ATP-dependent RNA helicase SUPV3L1/SUV3